MVPLVDFQVDEKHVTHVEQLWQLQKDSESTSQRLVEDGTKSHTNRSGFAEFFPSENAAMGKKTQELKSCQSVIETHRTEIHQEIQVQLPCSFTMKSVKHRCG